jgi:hypothetical protein
VLTVAASTGCPFLEAFEFVETAEAMVEEAMVEEAVAEEVVGDEDAAIFITTAKTVVKIAAVKPKAAAIEITAAKSGVAIVKLGKTTAVKVAIETTAAACHLC